MPKYRYQTTVTICPNKVELQEIQVWIHKDITACCGMSVVSVVFRSSSSLKTAVITIKFMAGLASDITVS